MTRTGAASARMTGHRSSAMPAAHATAYPEPAIVSSRASSSIAVQPGPPVAPIVASISGAPRSSATDASVCA